jgi:hypothetical protein
MTSRRGKSVSGLTLVAAFAVAFALSGATTASARISTFQTDYCHTRSNWELAPVTRENAMYLMLTARWEGYQWGGGCWNNNDYDETPNDPPGTFSGGEGPDCSGLVFKTFFLSDNTWESGFYYSSKYRNVHGPYATTNFKYGSYPSFARIGKSYAIFADALVSDTHMGLVYAKNANGTDQIFEAKGEAYGTNVWTRSYRGNSAYSAVRRKGWA